MSFNLTTQTSFAQARPSYSGGTWTRPADWITITDTTGEIQFLVSDVVYPVYSIQTQFTRPGAQNIYIDWGDGIINTISTTTATITNHTYTTGGTPCSRGYNTWKIRIYGDAGTQITEAIHITNTTYWGSSTIGKIGLLEEYYGDNTISTAQYLHTNPLASFTRPNCYYLEYSKLPVTMSGSGGIFDSTYQSCIKLEKVILPTSAANATSMTDTFSSCFSLQEVILPNDMTQITSMSKTFNTCVSLVKITFPSNLNACTNFTQTFVSCSSLGSVILPSTNSATSFNNTFNGCLALLNVEIKSWSQTSDIDLTSAFNTCRDLEELKLPNSIGSGFKISFTSIFFNATSLKSFTQFPLNFDTTDMSNAFNGCLALSKVSLPSSIPSLVNLNSCFVSCYQLSEITLPTTISPTNSINLGATFQNCYSLAEITIPSNYIVNSYQQTFNTCTSLKKITLSPLHNGTSLSNTFTNCYALETLTLPTSINSVNTMANAFAQCYSLTSLTLPSTMNSVITMATAFSNCRNLTSLTLPTSMTALTTMNNAFADCYSLQSLTLPTTTGNITTYANCFSNCFSLKTITFPTTQSTALTTLNSCFGLNYNLTTINNTQFLGNSSTTATIYIDATNMGSSCLRSQSLDFSCKFSRFTWNGISSSILGGLTSLRLRNNGSGQYAGASPQIDISNNSLGQAALVQVFNDLPTITAKTINISNNPGAPLLTAGERAIATGKGWTITG